MLAISICVILFVISIITRAAIRLGNKDVGIDAWYFLLYAEEFRMKKQLPVEMSYYLLDEEKQFYPPGMAILLSLFSKRTLERFHWLINPFIDSIQVVILFIFSYVSTSSLMLATFASLLYISSPILITQSSNLNSRNLGSLLLTITLLSICLFYKFPHIFYYYSILLFGVALLFCHKMSTQQLLFAILGLSLITLNSFFIGVFILIFAISLLLGRGYYLNLLKAHFEVVRFWSKNMTLLGAHQVYQSSLYRDEIKASVMKVVKGLRNSRTLYLLEQVKIVCIFFIIIYLYLTSRGSKNFDLIFYWLVLNYLTVLITSYLPGFKYLGEGYRYLIYGVFPASFLLCYYSFSKLSAPFSFILLCITLLINVIISGYIIMIQRKNSWSVVDVDLFAIYDVLKQLKGDNVLCFPFSKSDSLTYFTRKRVLFGSHNSGWEKLEPYWPVLKMPIEYFIRQYKINYILVDIRYLDFNDLKLELPFRQIEQKGNYRLIEVNY